MSERVPDPIRMAWISGVVARRAPWMVPVGEALVAAVAELHEVANDHTGALRTDLLGQGAGLHQGLAIGNEGHERAKHEAQAALLELAGADRAVAAEWVKTGIERAKPRAAPSTGR